jgi:hypothetical protein
LAIGKLELARRTKNKIGNGIVNLTDERPVKDAIRRYLSCSGNFRPQAHRRRAQFAMVAGGDVVARDLK